MHPAERRLIEINTLISDIQTPLGRYRRYADNSESIDLHVEPQKNWEFGTLRADRLVNAEKGRFTHYTPEQFKDMHSLLAELAHPLQNTIDRTLGDMVDHHMQGIASTWQLRLSEELLPHFLTQHIDQFDADAVQAIYKNREDYFFLDILNYIRNNRADYLKLYSTFSSPGRRDIRDGYALIIDQFGLFSTFGGQLQKYTALLQWNQHHTAPPLTHIDYIMSSEAHGEAVFSPPSFTTDTSFESGQAFHCAGEHFVRNGIGLNSLLNTTLAYYDKWHVDQHVALINPDGSYRSAVQQKQDYSAIVATA